MNSKFLHDCDAAREKFTSFEFVYRVLQPNDMLYLRKQSVAYKRAVQAVQDVILPAVHKHCSRCAYGSCCHLSTPELNIYIARSVGGFGLTDYLLARCDTELPVPYFANSRRNVCPFWDNGCRLMPDCRSFLCLQFFCESIRCDLDMDLVNERIAAVQSIVDSFSLMRLFRKKAQRYWGKKIKKE